MYKIKLSRKAAKFYKKVDTVTARRLNLVFTKLSEDPFRYRYNIKRLTGELEGSFRLRVGDTIGSVKPCFSATWEIVKPRDRSLFSGFANLGNFAK